MPGGVTATVAGTISPPGPRSTQAARAPVRCGPGPGPVRAHAVRPSVGPIPGPIHVVKFGSSVLAAPKEYRRVAGHVRDEVARGRKLITVVSAMGSTTDALLATAHAVAAEPPDALVGTLLATGEEASVALLRIALTDVGVRSVGFTAGQLCVRTRGPLRDADPVAVDTGRIAAALARSDVIVVPGFVGVDVTTGVPSLLGRGGSDLTALFLGQAMGAVEVRLVKDVDGVFPGDPRRNTGLTPLRTVSWDRVRCIGGGVVQDKALSFAARHRLGFRMAAMGGRGTWVGDAVRPPSP